MKLKREKVLFLDIDTQNDFMDPKGALYVPGAISLYQNIKKLTELAYMNGIRIISSIDTHIENDPEFSTYNFPPHCVKGSWGYEKINGSLLEKHIKIELNQNKFFNDSFRDAPQILIEKPSFSIFSNPSTEILLKQLNVKIVVIYGVATEYCVDQATSKLIEMGYNIFVIEDGIKGITKENEEATIYQWLTEGVILSSVEEITRFNIV